MEAKFENDILEISEIREEGGYRIAIFPDGVIHLYEIPQYGGVERFIGRRNNLYDAIIEAKSWT